MVILSIYIYFLRNSNVPSATVFNNANEHINVYGDDIEVDYRGYEVYNTCTVTIEAMR